MRAITRQIRLKEWTEVFRDRAESGMLVKDYCDAHGITKDTIAMSVLAMNIDRIQAKRIIIFLAKIYGLIRTALLETIQGSNDGPCMVAAY